MFFCSKEHKICFVKIIAIILLALPTYVFCQDVKHLEPPLSNKSQQTENTNLYNSIAKENLKSLTNIELEEANGLRTVCNQIEDQGWCSVIKAKFEAQLHPQPSIQRKLMYTVLANYEKNNPQTQTNILDEKTWQDLEILCGPKSSPTTYLANLIDRTITGVGQATLFRKIIQPTANVQELQKQQAITKELLSNEVFFKNLDDKLKELVEPENILLSYWDNEDMFALIMEQDKIKLPFDGSVESLKKTAHWLNTTPLIVDARSKMNFILWSISDLLLLYGSAALCVYIVTSYHLPYSPLQDLKNLPLYTALGVASFLMRKLCAEKTVDQGTAILAAREYLERAYWHWRDFGERDSANKCFYNKIHYVAKYVNNLKTMADCINQNQTLANKLPAIKRFNQALATMEKTSGKLKYLLDILATKTLAEEYKPSRFLNLFKSLYTYGGRVDVALRLMLELKEEFVEAMLAIGELDAQLSIAKLYKEFQNKRVTFCFPNYIDNHTVETPSIQAINFWNSFIEPVIVVPSSLNTGNLYQSPRNVIVTGPNAGGKSTITKAFIITSLLGQSIGIAPAEELTFTPFSKIITYLNITDDIAAGNSHFKAGVLRARDVITTTTQLEEHEFCLVAIDEIFNGTTFQEGQAAAFSLLKQLGENSRVTCITNTHFPLIPNLEKETGNFANYKVSVIEKANGKIEYPFFLERGISHQIVTLKILKEEGFGDSFIDVAEKILQQ